MVKHIKSILKLAAILFIITIFSCNSMTIENDNYTKSIHEKVQLLKELNVVSKYSTQEQNTDEGTMDEYAWYTSIEKAASDACDLITENADCSQIEAEAGLLISGNRAEIIVLHDTENTQTFQLDSNTLLNLNNCTINMASEQSIEFCLDLEIQNGTINFMESVVGINGKVSEEYT